MRGLVPEGDSPVPLGVARIAREGSDATIVTYGAMVREATAAAEQAAASGVEAEVVDLRTLKPMDLDTVVGSVRKTGRALVVHAANRLAGIGGEIAAVLAEEAFQFLDAPVRRLGGLDTPVPFSPSLEKAYRPDADDIGRALRELVSW